MIQNLFMKSLGRIILCCLTAAAVSACVKLPRRNAARGSQQTHARQTRQETPLVSLNEASREELERLPGVGPGLAARIVEHRERHGRFRRAEHLLLVRGIGERRFLELRPYLNVETNTP
ncbi:MAG TPA: helix-hairpin-helix domain-containing protein [Pyrinomonadaceae bacterium]